MNSNEWQIEKTPWGGTRRYRMVGGCKEYEKIVSTTAGDFTETQYAEYLKRAPEREARKKAEYARMAEEAKAQRSCPFKDGIKRACDKERCAFYDTGCILSKAAKKPATKDSKGLKCPVSKGGYSCLSDCAAYNHGCTLGNLFTEREV